MKSNISSRSTILFDGESTLNNYIGEAPIGSATSDSVWKIYRLNFTGTNSFSRKWADGSDKFDKVWDNRDTYTY